MRLREQIRLVNGNYYVVISVEHLEEVESAVFAKWGSSIIQTGGEIDEGGVTFELPESARAFPSQFPLQRTFPAGNQGADRAQAYLAVIVARIVAARDSLLAKDTSAVVNVVNEYPPGV